MRRDDYGWTCPDCHMLGHFCICYDIATPTTTYEAQQ